MPNPNSSLKILAISGCCKIFFGITKIIIKQKKNSRYGCQVIINDTIGDRNDMKWILAVGILLVSCPDDEKIYSDGDSPKPESTSTPEPATEPTPSPTPTATIDPDEDGWSLVPLEGEIRVNSGVYVRVDFDNHDLIMKKQLRLKLSECKDVKLIGGNTREKALDSESINTTVGETTIVFFYRPNGTINATPTNSCTFTAEVISREDGSVKKSKKKTFKMEEGEVKISQSKNPNNTPKPYFALDNDGDTTISFDTQGAITDDDLRIEIYKEDENRRFVLVGSALALNFRDTYGYLKGKVDEVKVCGPTVHVYERGNLYCGADLNNRQWPTTIPQGNHLLLVRAYDKETNIIAVRNALIETNIE